MTRIRSFSKLTPELESRLAARREAFLDGVVAAKRAVVKTCASRVELNDKELWEQVLRAINNLIIRGEGQ